MRSSWRGALAPRLVTTSLRAFATEAAGCLGCDTTFRICNLPSRRKTQSVKVPPVSVAIRMRPVVYLERGKCSENRPGLAERERGRSVERGIGQNLILQTEISCRCNHRSIIGGELQAGKVRFQTVRS